MTTPDPAAPAVTDAATVAATDADASAAATVETPVETPATPDAPVEPVEPATAPEPIALTPSGIESAEAVGEQPVAAPTTGPVAPATTTITDANGTPIAEVPAEPTTPAAAPSEPTPEAPARVDAAPLEPAAPPAPIEPPAVQMPTVADTAAGLLRGGTSLALFDHATGGPIDPETAFKRPDEFSSQMICTVRIIERIEAGPHQHEVTRLLLPVGAQVAPETAALLLERIRTTNLRNAQDTVELEATIQVDETEQPATEVAPDEPTDPTPVEL